MTDDIPTIRRILKDNHTIAMVGLSASWFRPSYFAAKYLQDHGFRVMAVRGEARSPPKRPCRRTP